jgi:hypothetical protein
MKGKVSWYNNIGDDSSMSITLAIKVVSYQIILNNYLYDDDSVLLFYCTLTIAYCLPSQFQFETRQMYTDLFSLRNETRSLVAFLLKL